MKVTWLLVVGSAMGVQMHAEQIKADTGAFVTAYCEDLNCTKPAYAKVYTSCGSYQASRAGGISKFCVPDLAAYLNNTLGKYMLLEFFDDDIKCAAPFTFSEVYLADGTCHEYYNDYNGDATTKTSTHQITVENGSVVMTGTDNGNCASSTAFNTYFNQPETDFNTDVCMPGSDTRALKFFLC